MAAVEVNLNGPALDSEQFGAAVQLHLQRAVETVSRQAKNNVVGHLVTFIRKPTPYYWTQVTTERLRPLVDRVHDRDMIYGPWLEGVSERNRSTRFKGYAAFRKQTQRTQAQVQEITRPVFADLVKVMNG